MPHHHFEPDTYYINMGSHPPVLAVDPGDTITTRTIDARGGDYLGKTVSPPSNPQTGPFFVNGAEPGDSLVFRLESLRPNRADGFTRAVVAPTALDLGFQPSFDDDFEFAFWDIDVEAETVRLREPRNGLSDVTLPLRPMLGCFGVAPPDGQAISCATSGAYGGNMDYNGFGEGIRVDFPVFMPGALFHLGDGHALQGDGEIDGTGLEVSMDVTFTLDLIKGKTIAWPRAENDSHIMTVGNVRPLDQAVQHATTEMIAWLVGDYGLGPREAHMLLGRCVEYDLGNVYDPAYTMVCKVNKAILRELNDAS